MNEDRSQIRVTKVCSQGRYTFRPRIYQVADTVHDEQRQVLPEIAAELVAAGAARWGDQ